MAALFRRRRWPLAPSLAASGAVLIVVVGLVQYPSTLWVVFPSFDTWSAVGTDLREAWDAFGIVKAPAEVLPGFIVAGAVRSKVKKIMPIIFREIRDRAMQLVPELSRAMPPAG